MTFTIPELGDVMVCQQRELNVIGRAIEAFARGAVVGLSTSKARIGAALYEHLQENERRGLSWGYSFSNQEIAVVYAASILRLAERIDELTLVSQCQQDTGKVA